MPSPSLYLTNFADDRCRVDSYWSRLRKLDVPAPKTTFVRTQVKAATVRLRDGSFIYRHNPEVIDDVGLVRFERLVVTYLPVMILANFVRSNSCSSSGISGYGCFFS